MISGLYHIANGIAMIYIFLFVSHCFVGDIDIADISVFFYF